MKTIRKAKVICLSVAGNPGNKIFRKGEMVTEKQFPNGLFDKQIEGKFIEEVFEEKKENLELDLDPSKGNLELFENETGKKKEDVEPKLIDSFSEKQLKKALRKANIEFSDEATKEDLFSLFQGIEK